MNKDQSRDYLFSTGYVRSLERGFFSRERAERLMGAKDNDDVLSILSDCGYREALAGAGSIDAGLNAYRRELFDDFKSFLPSKSIVEVLQLKYDFHNIKAAVKCDGNFVQARALFIDAGVYSPDAIVAAIPEGNAQLPTDINAVIIKSCDIFSRTRDPQLTDFYLDREMFATQMSTATTAGNEFLSGYVRMLGDISNLRSFARADKLGKVRELLPNALTDIAEVMPQRLLNISNEAVETLYRGLLYPAALAVSENAPMGQIDKLCDDALIGYLSKAKYVNYGSEPAIAYLCIREFEITQIRIILAGRAAGLTPESIRERLRSFYV